MRNGYDTVFAPHEKETDLEMNKKVRLNQMKTTNWNLVKDKSFNKEDV